MTTAQKQFLILRLRADLALREWAVCNGSGAILRGPFQTESSDFQTACQLPCLLLCASPELVVRSVQVPSRAQDRFRQAVSFALEDRFACDVDALYFALPQVLSAGEMHCIVASKRFADALSGRLRTWGISQAQLLPECLLMPPDSVLLERDIASFQLADQFGAIEPDSLGLIFKQRQLQTGQLPMTLYHADHVSLKTMPAHVTVESLGYVLHFLLQRALLQPRWGSLLALGDQASGRTALTTSTHGGNAVGRGNTAWRWALRLALLAALLQGVGFGFRYWQLYQIEQAQQQEIKAMFAKVFPNLVAYEGAAMDPLGMLASRLQQDSARNSALQGGGVLAILSLAAPILAGEARVVLVNAEYRQGELELGLRTPDLRTLDEVRARLATRAELNVSLGSNVVDPNGQMLTGRIKLALRTLP